MKFLVADSLYCDEARYCSHLDSYAHWLREAGQEVAEWRLPSQPPAWSGDVLFALDHYAMVASVDARARIAQVAAVCSPMPWDVRRDGRQAYDLVLSSIPWMVQQARAHGCQAEWMPLAFDTRALDCSVTVRDLGCVHIGTTGPNHRRRGQLLHELRDVVTVLPPVFGGEYFRTLSRAHAVLNVHAEWAHGVANNMRLFEAAGMGCHVVSDGEPVAGIEPWWWEYETVAEAREAIAHAMGAERPDASVFLGRHTYAHRVAQLIAYAGDLLT